MCYFRVCSADLDARFGLSEDAAMALFEPALQQFGEVLEMHRGDLLITDKGRALTRMIAQSFDAYEMAAGGHTLAV